MLVSGKLPSNLLKIFLTLSLLSGIIGYLSAYFDNPILRLWKEIYIISLFIICLLIALPRIHKVNLLVISMSVIFFCSMATYSRHVDFVVLMYQLKLDLVLVLYFIVVYTTYMLLQYDEINRFTNQLIKLVVFLSAANSITTIWQSIFTNQYLSLVGLNYGNWGNDAGVRIITVLGELRPPGLQLGFVPTGTLMLLSFIVLIESRKLLNFKKLPFLVLGSLFILGIYFSTYKTALFGLILYVFIKIIEFLVKKKTFNTPLITILSLSALMFFFVSTHFMTVYKVFAEIHPYYAYNSILIRIQLHYEILDTLNSLKEYLFGVGMGVNGTFGLDKSLYGLNPVPTDSTYIYLVSNYGYIFTFVFTLMLVVLLYKLTNISRFDFFGAKYMIIYVLAIEFFYNNAITSFPSNILIITATTSAFIYQKVLLESQIKNEHNIENT